MFELLFFYLFVHVTEKNRVTLFNLGGILKDFFNLSLVSFKIVMGEGGVERKGIQESGRWEKEIS